MVVPARTAGLAGNKAIVHVNPPLLVNVPRFGLALVRLVALVNARVVSELKLLPASTMAPPKKFPPSTGLATMQFRKIKDPVPWPRFPPPPPPGMPAMPLPELYAPFGDRKSVV